MHSPSTNSEHHTAPSDKPTELTCLEVNTTSVKLSWSPPPKEKQNGAIIGYRVEVDGPDPIHPMNVVDKNAKVDRLRPNTKYIFKVSAKTEAGSGPAATVECITRPGGKGFWI